MRPLFNLQERVGVRVVGRARCGSVIGTSPLSRVRERVGVRVHRYRGTPRRGPSPAGGRCARGTAYRAGAPVSANAGTGCEYPFSVSGPTASTCQSSPSAARARRSIRVCPGFASPHSRAARLTTLPIAV
jgi:hypothetical protein